MLRLSKLRNKICITDQSLNLVGLGALVNAGHAQEAVTAKVGEVLGKAPFQKGGNKYKVNFHLTMLVMKLIQRSFLECTL